jgi:uncharacterized membrane protein
MSLEPNYIRHYTKRISEFRATTLSPSKNRGYIAEIDQLRAMAAMLVLPYHGFQLFNPNVGITTASPILAIIVEGHSGVGLFIVLSGFILTLGSRQAGLVQTIFGGKDSSDIPNAIGVPGGRHQYPQE